MLEQAREIVEKFNKIYGETLVLPKAIIPEKEMQRRLPGVDGKAKMSKSLGNCIYLSDDPKIIKKQVNGKMFTDPTHLQISDPGHTEGKPIGRKITTGDVIAYLLAAMSESLYNSLNRKDRA